MPAEMCSKIETRAVNEAASVAQYRRVDPELPGQPRWRSVFGRAFYLTVVTETMTATSRHPP